MVSSGLLKFATACIDTQARIVVLPVRFLPLCLHFAFLFVFCILSLIGKIKQRDISLILSIVIIVIIMVFVIIIVIVIITPKLIIRAMNMIVRVKVTAFAIREHHRKQWNITFIHVLKSCLRMYPIIYISLEIMVAMTFILWL